MYRQPPNLIQTAKDMTERRLNIYDGPVAELKSIFTGFLNALHESKRIKAERVLCLYRGLIAEVNARSSATRGEG